MKSQILSLIIAVLFFPSCKENGLKKDVRSGLKDSIYFYIEEGYQSTIRYRPNDTGIYFGLPHPYVVPFGEEDFNALFYWDTYFTNKGLYLTGMDSLAKNNVDNLLYEVDKWGYVLNINHKYGTHRTQQPYLSLMVMDVYKHYPDSTEWLMKAYNTLKKEYDFWMTNRMTPIGLNRDYHEADEEMLLGFYDYLKKERFPQFNFKDKDSILEISSHLFAELEVWDFTPRFDMKCHNFCPVDLNSNLYLYEKNFAELSKILSLGEETKWLKRAQKRKELMNKYLWNEEKQMFCDYDFVNTKKSDFVSVAMFNPLFTGWASKVQAEKTLENLTKLEYDYGVSTCQQGQYSYVFQWDYPNGWAPMQYIVAHGLANYGFASDAKRIRDKYVSVVENNYSLTKHLWEKYNVVEGSIEVKDEYKMPEMFGWTAGVYLDFLNMED